MSMGQVSVKRASDPPADDDGMRVLVDRRWPPGLSKEKVAADLWLKEAGPSEALRRWGSRDPGREATFKARYRTELAARDDLVHLLHELRNRGPVTLLSGIRDPSRNGTAVLLEVLEERHGAVKGGKP
jgi:uncharacterized protein YeaO (DUF488 family)